jgi:hypothetical protein
MKRNLRLNRWPESYVRGLVALIGFGLVSCERKPKEADVGVDTDQGKNYLNAESFPPSIVSYERSKYSVGLTGSGGEFVPVSEEERKLHARLIERLEKSQGRREVFEEVLAEARSMESELILAVAMQVMESPDAAIRAQGLMLIDGVSDGVVLPLIAKGYGDEDLDVRQLAMETALAVRSPEVEGLVVQGLADADETIRQTAFQVGLNQEGEVAERALMNGMASPYEDLGLAALAMAENELSKKLLPSVIQALDHRSAEVREAAREMMYFFFHENFSSRGDAAAWWAKNQKDYADNLVYEGR